MIRDELNECIENCIENINVRGYTSGDAWLEIVGFIDMYDKNNSLKIMRDFRQMIENNYFEFTTEMKYNTIEINSETIPVIGAKELFKDMIWKTNSLNDSEYNYKITDKKAKLKFYSKAIKCYTSSTFRNIDIEFFGNDCNGLEWVFIVKYRKGKCKGIFVKSRPDRYHKTKKYEFKARLEKEIDEMFESAEKAIDAG